jgi:hypothetical protein
MSWYIDRVSRTSVSDEVWRQLDQHAGQLSARTYRRVRWLAVIAIVAAVVLATSWYAGVPGPRLTAGWNGRLANTDTRVFQHEITITNQNRWLPVRIEEVGRDGPGLNLLPVTGFTPQTLALGEALSFTLSYQVTDCAAVPDEPWPLAVRIHRPWGVQTLHVQLPGELSDDAPAEYSVSDGQDPYEIPWQRAAAEVACGFRS